MSCVSFVTCTYEFWAFVPCVYGFSPLPPLKEEQEERGKERREGWERGRERGGEREGHRVGREERGKGRRGTVERGNKGTTTLPMWPATNAQAGYLAHTHKPNFCTCKINTRTRTHIKRNSVTG